MRYFSSTATEIQNFSKGILVENHEFEKRAAAASLDAFLAHSSADKEALPKAIAFLRQYGVNIYIEKSDKELPQTTPRKRGQNSSSELSNA